MADEVISSTQPDTGNLLGDDIGGLDHFSSSSPPFQNEPLQPQPSAPQPMSTSPPSKPLVDDFGFDPPTTTTSSNPPAAPNSSNTPGELTSSTINHDHDDDYKENHHQHKQGEGNNYHHDDDDDDGYDDREEDVEEINYHKNGAPYQDNPAFSDSDSPSEFLHRTEAPREPSPLQGAPTIRTGGETDDKLGGGYDSDEHHKYDDDDVVVRKDDHHRADQHYSDDDDEADSLTEDNVVLDDDDDDQFVYNNSGSAATTDATANNAFSSSPPFTTIPDSPVVIEPPSKSFEKESSPISPFSSSSAAKAEEASYSSSAYHEDKSPAAADYAPPSPSAPPAAAPFSSSPPSAAQFSSSPPSDHDATSSIISHGDDDDDAASGFADADFSGRISPTAAAATEMGKTMDYDRDDDVQMPSAPLFSSSVLSDSQPLAPSAPPQPVETADPFHSQITSSTPQQASSTLYNSHSTRESEPESFTAENPKEVQPKPTLEGPWLKTIDPKVLDLIYWRDVKKTGVVFGSMLFILLSLAIFSVLSVVAYLSLAILAVTLSFRVYKNIMQAVQKSGDGHPFKDYLEWDIELNDAKTSKVVKLVMKHFNCTVRELRRLFLVEDLVDSIKFGLLLWVLTYIGSWFNGMTLIINSVVIVFTLPKVYETYKVQIDNYLAMARSQFNKILQQVQAKLPFLKKKAKAQ